MHLSELKTGESGTIIKVLGHGGFRRRILEMGFVRGQRVTVLLNAPLKDPIKYKVMDYEVSLRRSEAYMIEVVSEEGQRDYDADKMEEGGIGTTDSETIYLKERESAEQKYKEINIALVGNPNSGKTSLFNALSGGHEHVGNYSGVTVDAKSNNFKYKGYNINITDLPGTYALTAYTPEELYVRKYIADNVPDIILNAVVSSNLERNLFLTTELIDINQKSVVALNMYDELQKSGATLDYKSLGKLIGIPMVPVVARERVGLDKLMDTIIAVYESGYGKNESKTENRAAGKTVDTAKNEKSREEDDDEVAATIRHIHIRYSPAIEREIKIISKEIKMNPGVFPDVFPPRYWSIKLMEGDREVEKHLRKREDFSKWMAMRDAAFERVKKELGEDVESAVADEKYGFISGALKETYTPGSNEQNKTTTIIDSIVIHKLFSFPIFLLLIWIMFNATFSLGAYPQEWIESFVSSFAGWIGGLMEEGPLKDLITNGIIGGVGSVLVFLPNILILYLFISLMEDSGYMARAAFIMDKLMHKIGLHGKSFIPLIMGFGCNVPAIISTRTIESRTSRLITILINPFISCSARLPVYILIAGTFFPKNTGTVLMLLYLFGIFVAIATAKLLRRFLFSEDETPFVMELPPYRIPTMNATLSHLWGKCEQYLKKIGSIILAASIIIWFLSYYPKGNTGAEAVNGTGEREYSYLEQIGKGIEPVLKPLGLNWKAGVALISGASAKEIIVSTLGVLYTDNESTTEYEGGGGDDRNETMISAKLLASGDFTAASAISFMLFVLLYFPCIGTISTIAKESSSWKWAIFSILYSCTVAWIVSFVAYNLFSLILP